jgi:hypothetical protein
MFKFSFGSRRAKKRLSMPKGVHILQEHELEKSVGGGTPVRQLLYPVSMPDWVRNTASGAGLVGEMNYSRYTQMFPGAQWQSGITWEPRDDIKQATNNNHYDS